ncbi:AAA family ATPase [Candidatus Bathyarchaeota archaeon]|nr:AAA family ATPase [Candidatus Bathyarchaeota archaeon]
MKIDSILIENIRSHVKTYIKFSEGFNCLVGGLGAGKSSILYAIDFALFGDPIGRSYEYLLREGANVGRVALKFIENGKEYTLWRGLRRRGNRISQDTEQLKLFKEDKLIAEMKNEAVTEQLKSIIGIDKEVFRDIIWVRQEKLKEILDMTPTERRKKLDQLFGVSDYEVSWANLRSIQRWYESEKRTMERDPDVINMENMQKTYEESIKELSMREAELEETRKQLQEAELKLKEASTHLEGIMALRRESETLKAREAEFRAKIGSLEGICTRLMREVKERRIRVNELEERLEALKIREEAIRKNLKDLGLPADLSQEELQSHIDSIIEQISSIQGEGENVRSEIKRATQRITNLIKESKCPLCLQPLSPEYKDRLIKNLYQEISDYRQQLNELEKNMKELGQLRSSLFTIFSNLQAIQPKKEEIVRQLENERNLLNEALRELNEKEKEIKIIKKQLSTLQSKITKFDHTRFEEAQRLYNEAMEKYSSLKYKVQTLETQKNEIMLRLKALKERLDVAQDKIERLEKVNRILEFIEEARQAYRSIQPKIRRDFIKYFERVIQHILDDLAGSDGPSLTIKIDENYTPIVVGEEGHERSVLNISGGERTFLALAYRLGVGQLIMHIKSGRGLSMLLLDEPTESLGREDGSIDRLAELISRLKTVEQIIAVTHSEAFAEKADYVIRVEKKDGRSSVLIEQS